MMEKKPANSLHTRLLSIDEVAEIMGIRPQTIRNQMSKRLFPIKHKKIGKLVKFDSRTVEKYLRCLPEHY